MAGNHHDLYNIETSLKDIFDTLSKANIALDGLFINADSGFDSKNFRQTCLDNGIFANIAFNHRNGNDTESDCLLDDLL
jgi:hypothetical protein